VNNQIQVVLVGDPEHVALKTLYDEKAHLQFIKKIQQDEKMYQNFIIPYLYEVQHVSGVTPPIIRSLKLHW
jgi:hypothetical protein